MSLFILAPKVLTVSSAWQLLAPHRPYEAWLTGLLRALCPFFLFASKGPSFLLSVWVEGPKGSAGRGRGSSPPRTRSRGEAQLPWAGSTGTQREGDVGGRPSSCHGWRFQSLGLGQAASEECPHVHHQCPSRQGLQKPACGGPITWTTVSLGGGTPPARSGPREVLSTRQLCQDCQVC